MSDLLPSDAGVRSKIYLKFKSVKWLVLGVGGSDAFRLFQVRFVMNAAEQVRNFGTASKVGAIANLFKSKFPAARVDLKPWLNSADIWELLDPHSLDLGFHFPGVSRLMQARSILCQIRLHHYPSDGQELGEIRAIGIDALGYNYRGQCWQFSTIADWTFTGETAPIPDGKAEFKDFCTQVLYLFNY